MHQRGEPAEDWDYYDVQSQETEGTHLVDLRDIQTGFGDDGLGLLGNLSVHGRGETIESHSVNGTGKIHAILQRLDGTSGGTAACAQTSLGMFNGQSKLGLGSLVGLRAGFGAGNGQGDLGLLGEFLGKVLTKQIVERLAAQVGLSTLSKLDVFTLSSLADGNVQTRLSQIDDDHGLVSVLMLSLVSFLRLAQQGSLLPFLGKANPVSDQDGGGFIQKLEDGDTRGGSGGFECVSLSTGEPSRARDDGASGLDTEEVGSALEQS